jgi:hypothetical protein
MEILAIVGLFIGLSLVAAIPLVILLRSAEALAWRREHGADAATGAAPSTASDTVLSGTVLSGTVLSDTVLPRLVTPRTSMR